MKAVRLFRILSCYPQYLSMFLIIRQHLEEITTDTQAEQMSSCQLHKCNGVSKRLKQDVSALNVTVCVTAAQQQSGQEFSIAYT